MRRKLFYLSIALFAFGIGLFVAFNKFSIGELWTDFAGRADRSEKRLTVCQLIDNPEEFDGKVIKIEAIVYYNAEMILKPKDGCAGRNYGILSLSPILEVDNFDGENSNLKNLLREKKEIDLEIKGIGRTKIDQRFSPPLFFYSIVPIEIRPISELRPIEPSGSGPDGDLLRLPSRKSK